MKPKEQQEARSLRKQGLSIREICVRLGVAKSSVSLWVRDIELTDEQIEHLDRKMLLNRQHFGYLSRCGGANRNKEEAEKRHRAFEQAGYDRAKDDDRFRVIAALYWGEGQKRNKGSFNVSNYDPSLLRIILDWLIDEGFDQRIWLRVQYYTENGLSEDDIRVWWLAQLPNLREHHFRKFTRCILNRASQRKKIGKRPYGTATVGINHTELFFNVLGGIKYLQEWAIGETVSRHAYTVE